MAVDSIKISSSILGIHWTYSRLCPSKTNSASYLKMTKRSKLGLSWERIKIKWEEKLLRK